jgi:hypothetical protein
VELYSNFILDNNQIEIFTYHTISYSSPRNLKIGARESRQRIAVAIVEKSPDMQA